MSFASARKTSLLSMKFVFILFGILAFLANAHPGKPHALATSLGDVDLVYEVTGNAVAVIPELERDTRARPHPADSSPDGKLPTALVPRVGEKPAARAFPLLASAPPRFYHLDQRTSPSRAPPSGDHSGRRSS